MKDTNTLNWNTISQSLSDKGYVHLPGILTEQECNYLASLYDDPSLFRSTINMKRYRFGDGEYKYFSYPLPLTIQTLREMFYPPLATIANDWMKKLSLDIEFPLSHADFIGQCRNHKQLRPTPLILRYEAGGYNTLHQDLYGDVYFPFQIVFMLSEPDRDYTGGELVLTEQIPRAQTRAEVLRPRQGDAVIFTTNFRPANGSRGYYRTTMRHGVSEIHTGIRYSMGVIFHDAA